MRVGQFPLAFNKNYRRARLYLDLLAHSAVAVHYLPSINA